MEEDAQWVAYCPPLEVSTYGDTLEEAQEAFTEALQLFLEDMIERGSLEKELIRLGWTLAQSRYRPPQIKSAAIDAMDNPRKISYSVRFPSVNGSSPHAHASA